ncbi:carbohydrate kinase family protein [Marmoricola sp. URHB0036]|uniref:carbohydrate kinase family protein n=1 Tax=Marmoricola sp. URHB0036 TaxID=1298863 RepID=UPI000408789C|nr:carbohydrate kinase family protein [Marmoricola sp. URHB0036]
MTDVLVVGDANPDLILSGDVVPRFGQVEQLLDGADLVIGGSGGILANGLARLGRSTRLVAATGSDLLGDLMRQLLSAGGVETTALLRQQDHSTGITIVLTSPDDRAVLTYLGAIPLLSRVDVQSALDLAVLDGVRHVHVASYYLLGALAPDLPGLLEDARSRGLTTSLDTNFDPAERWDGVADLLPHLDLLLPNRQEAFGLAGRLTGAAPADVEAGAAALAAAGPVVVVKDGAAGAVSVDRSGHVLREAATAVVTLDATGAGDTFDAAYLDSFLRGLDPQECLRRACLAGAISTSALGGTGGQPTIDQLSSPGRDADVLRQL